MNLGMFGLGQARPVHNDHLSTSAVHRGNGAGKPKLVVFPVVHTLYDYYERF